MKKNAIKAICLILLLMVAALVGCSSNSTDSSSKGSKEKDGSKKVKIAYFVSGTLGDKSFWDSGLAGIERARDELGIEAKVVESGTNQSDFSSGLESLAA